MLANLKSGKFEGFPKFSVGPLTLFEVPVDDKTRKREWLQPVAIQCDRIDPSGLKPKPPMFTPKVFDLVFSV
jgi:hypothetical protein